MSLAGRTIALPESRELDRLAELVEHDGGTAWRCPLVTIRDAPDARPSEEWVRALAAGAFDDVIFLTGEGLRRLLATADRLGAARRAPSAAWRAPARSPAAPSPPARCTRSASPPTSPPPSPRPPA